ncbi:MAG TPA: TIGR02588 family protein [Candidatus Binatia bacterium]|nr:TIGR02588 family protein [Candidatus Binatia bacterium]HEU4638588.1 TIGR02588 family protein [Candidatus Binatia bacterium]HYQ98239.1 TIGR02588 family protein [Candidatus Nitrosocosmicus sp.]
MAARTDHTTRGRQGSKMPALTEARSTSQKQQEKDAIPIWEWIVAGVGLVLVASVIGFLIYEAFTGKRLPPDVKLSVDSVVEIRNGFLVRITAVNEGGMTAEGVIVEAELRSGTEPVERSRTTIDYLPPRSEKRAGLFFTRDPRQLDLQVRSLGYEEP